MLQNCIQSELQLLEKSIKTKNPDLLTQKEYH